MTPLEELTILKTLPASFQKRVKITGLCWEWIGGKQSQGYGVYYPEDGTGGKLVHRWTYEKLIGPIPKGLTLDHIRCDSKCANPFCCEPATRGDNAARYKLDKTHCRKGHKYTKENTFIRREGYRVCITCRRDDKALSQSKRASQLPNLLEISL